jgi:hypothetical protein
MARTKAKPADVPAELAEGLAAALQRERIVQRFVDSYVVEHGRYGLQVHAALYRDLLSLLQREALLAVSARALEIIAAESAGRNPGRAAVRSKGADAFRRQYLAALVRQQRWTAGDALDFHKDFRVYEEVIARAASGRRRKPFEAANHPFVDRCAFLLDSSFMELARMAASRTLTELENLAGQVVASLFPKKSVGSRSSARHG